MYPVVSICKYNTWDTSWCPVMSTSIGDRYHCYDLCNDKCIIFYFQNTGCGQGVKASFDAASNDLSQSSSFLIWFVIIMTNVIDVTEVWNKNFHVQKKYLSKFCSRFVIMMMVHFDKFDLLFCDLHAWNSLFWFLNKIIKCIPVFIQIWRRKRENS